MSRSATIVTLLEQARKDVLDAYDEAKRIHVHGYDHAPHFRNTVLRLQECLRDLSVEVGAVQLLAKILT